MKDIQSQLDHRRINIKKVGVKDISYPVTVLDKERKLQKTVAKVNMYVNLPHRFKGTHMSRFIEILNRFHGQIDLKSFRKILEEMKEKLQAQSAHMEIEFPFFLKKRSRYPNAIGTGEYECRMHGSLSDTDELTLEIRLPVAPPPLAQQDEGLPRSLGQWGGASVSLRCRHFIWIEDLIQMLEEVIANSRRRHLSSDAPGARAELQPMSVEEIAISLGRRLAAHPDIRWYSVTVENLADGYSTFATLEWPESEAP